MTKVFLANATTSTDRVASHSKDPWWFPNTLSYGHSSKTFADSVKEILNFEAAVRADMILRWIESIEILSERLRAEKMFSGRNLNMFCSESGRNVHEVAVSMNSNTVYLILWKKKSDVGAGVVILLKITLCNPLKSIMLTYIKNIEELCEKIILGS